MFAVKHNTQLHIVPRPQLTFSPRKKVTVEQCLDDVTGTYYQNIKIVTLDSDGEVSLTYANRVPQKTLHFVIQSAQTSNITTLEFVTR